MTPAQLTAVIAAYFASAPLIICLRPWVTTATIMGKPGGHAGKVEGRLEFIEQHADPAGYMINQVIEVSSDEGIRAYVWSANAA